MIPLAVAPIGKEMTIAKIITDTKTKRHLENLGILVGGEVSSMADSAGNLILKIKEGRLAINKELAMKIYVN
ncbi:MAG: FeoA family protein [Clostridia bacterium]